MFRKSGSKMLLRIATICLLTSTISVICRHLHKHHHHQKHSKRHVNFDEPSQEIEKSLPRELECWKSDDSEEPNSHICVTDEDQNVDEFFAACMSIVNVTSGCWIHQSISLQNCNEDCVVTKDSLAPFCCCTTPNCNHPSRIVYKN